MNMTRPPKPPDCTGLPDLHYVYLIGVLDSIVTEAWATKGRLRSGIATAILILDREERGIVSRNEARALFRMAETDVCGDALLSRNCPHNHAWVTVTTDAGESFELPIKRESHS